MQDLHGKIVSEEEAAHGLGFKDVYELRRWQTDLGHKFLELDYKFGIACNEAQRFRYHGMKMGVVLEKIKPFLEHLKSKGYENVDDFLLAIDVVSGQGCDWDHRLEDWWTGLVERSRYDKSSLDGR